MQFAIHLPDSKKRDKIFEAADQIGIEVFHDTRKHISIDTFPNLSVTDTGKKISGNCSDVGDTKYDWMKTVPEFISILEQIAGKRTIGLKIVRQPTRNDTILLL